MRECIYQAHHSEAQHRTLFIPTNPARGLRGVPTASTVRHPRHRRRCYQIALLQLLCLCGPVGGHAASRAAANSHVFAGFYPSEAASKQLPQLPLGGSSLQRQQGPNSPNSPNSPNNSNSSNACPCRLQEEGGNPSRSLGGQVTECLAKWLIAVCLRCHKLQPNESC